LANLIEQRGQAFHDSGLLLDHVIAFRAVSAQIIQLRLHFIGAHGAAAD
jgi:hypothetical protein